MSSTRTNTSGVFKPERYSSSPEFDRPLKANLVAARCSVLESPDLKELCWFIQGMSLHRGGLRWVAAEIAPLSISNSRLDEWLATLCLDPATDGELQEIAPALRELIAAYARQRGERGAETEIGRQITGALDYCSQAHGLILVSGNPRVGKTWTAKHWIEQHFGKGRYCEVPSCADDTSFFMALASALGVTVESNAKRKNLQPRIEAVLKGGDLVLVLDECANLWPGFLHRQHSRPPRVSWVTSMINAGASIALLVTPNFSSAEKDFLSHARWQAAQFYGRIARYVTLPDRVALADLEKIARAWLPQGDRRAIEALADVANLSQKHAAAIEHVVKLATYFARQDGRDQAEWPDLKRAITTDVMPSDTALAAALSQEGRRVPASGAR
jgi:hypothetical protein